MTEQSAEYFLAAALARIAALEALVPPEPGAPGQVLRVGRTHPETVYAHDGAAQVGRPIAVLPSEEWAALVTTAVNAWLANSRPPGEALDVRLLQVVRAHRGLPYTDAELVDALMAAIHPVRSDR